MKLRIGLLAALIGGTGVFQSMALSAQDQPNIILLLLDDTDKYQVGCYGGPVYTPNIDQLAEEGLLFHNAHINSPICTPSRYGFTTGRYAGRSAYADYLDQYPVGSQGHPEFNVGLEHDFMNIGHALQTAGYTTGWVGKFHMHADNTLEGGLTSAEKDFLKNASPDDPRATELFKREEQAYRDYIVNKGFSWAKHIYEGNLNDPFNHHNLEWTIEAALEFIDSVGDKPFYLHFNTTLLHGPDKSWERSFDYPEHTGEGLTDGVFEANMPPRSTIIERIESNGYNLKDNPAGITWMDDGVGAIMDKLDELGIAENTILAVVPDHGSANKASLFSMHGTNIPMIIRYPEMIQPGLESSSLVQGIDLLPTFYELAGVDLPEAYHLDGTSLAPLFNAPETKLHESLYFELGCARGVITDKYKYIAVRYTQDRINKILGIPEDDLKESIIKQLIYLDGHIGISTRGIKYSPEYLSPDQLYNWNSDPGELNNLAEDPSYQEVLGEMKDRLSSYLALFPGRPFGEFIPGPNAAAPDSLVVQYIRNIQSALRNGASLDRDVIICDGNCVVDSDDSDDTEDPGTTGYSQHESSAKIVQGPDHLIILPVEGTSVIKLFDMKGRRLSNTEYNESGQLVINTSGYQPGLYLLTMEGKDKKQFCQKVIIN
ncbi:MAG: sulfatase-like hydrolase/transferase [Bacteroidales bacterium]